MNWKTACAVATCTTKLSAAPLSFTIIPYESFAAGGAAAIEQLKTALLEQGIVGIKGVPGLEEKVHRFIDTARAFSALPDEVKSA